jgi:DNA-binding response OmpR family regulator
MGREWQPRAMLRAQLLEEGCSTVATDSWPAAEALLFTEGLPRVLVVILDEATAPLAMLDRILALVPASRIVVLSTPSLASRDTLLQRGVTDVLERPFSIGDVVKHVRRLVRQVSRGST